MRLQLQTSLQTSYGYAGLSYDTGKGTVAVGFNPVDRDAGGEGATLDAGPAHDPAFVLVDEAGVPGAVVSDVLPPIEDGQVRLDTVFIANVDPGLASITLIEPAAGACALRFSVTEWPVVANVMTVIDVDCLP